MVINVNGKPADAHEIGIRTGGPFLGEHKTFKSDSKVSVTLRYGQHVFHRFTAEPDYKKGNNDKLTQEFGWTVVCNDRVILYSDRSAKTGWESKFHDEYYGFVGVVEFVDQSPGLLPWNTLKTDVDLNNNSYQTALTEMRKFAQKWRKFAGVVKKIQVPLLPPTAQPTVPVAQKPKRKTGKTEAKKSSPSPKGPQGPTKKPDHNQFETVLPNDIDELHCDDKLLALVHEAQNLNLRENSYSGLALIRMLVEVSSVRYCERHNRFNDLKAHSIQFRNKNRKNPLNKKEIADFWPKIHEALAFLSANPSIFGPSKEIHLGKNVKTLTGDIKRLHSAIHDPITIIGFMEAFRIRDDALPLLRHLLEG